MSKLSFLEQYSSPQHSPQSNLSLNRLPSPKPSLGIHSLPTQTSLHDGPQPLRSEVVAGNRASIRCRVYSPKSILYRDDSLPSILSPKIKSAKSTDTDAKTLVEVNMDKSGSPSLKQSILSASILAPKIHRKDNMKIGDASSPKPSRIVGLDKILSPPSPTSIAVIKKYCSPPANRKHISSREGGYRRSYLKTEGSHPSKSKLTQFTLPRHHTRVDEEDEREEEDNLAILSPQQSIYYCLRTIASLDDSEKTNHPHYVHFSECHKTLKIMVNDKLVENPPQGVPQFNRSKRMILALDLDETLVHCCNFDSVEMQAKATHTANYISERKMKVIAKLTIRPYVHYFLSEASKLFDLVVFTASEREYAQAVVDILDPTRRYIRDIYSRKHCVRTHLGYVVKDMRTVCSQTPSTVLLLDNSIHCMCPQLTQGIPIIPFHYDAEDEELVRILPFLQRVSKESSPAKMLQGYFGWNIVHRYPSARDALEAIKKVAKMGNGRKVFG